MDILCSVRLVVFSILFYAPCIYGDMFAKTTWLNNIKTNQRNYGVAVSDVNHDGKPDFIVAGFDGPNFVFVYDHKTGTVRNIVEDTAFSELQDPAGQAIGVAACDIDGDGKEEIYFLNTNQAYAGKAKYGDKIFKWRNGRYEDLYNDTVNRNLDARTYAGRSVACLDRNGDGKYGFVLATYSSGTTGRFALIEMDESSPDKIVLRNYGGEAGIAKSTGGRGIVVGPILGHNGRSDIFFGNEGNPGFGNDGANFLFMNKGDGTFIDIANATGVIDQGNTVRGIAMADFNKDGLIDLAYGNWVGPHRLFLQQKDKDSKPVFKDQGGKNAEYMKPTPIRTVIAADFDNDGNLEIFQNNIVNRGLPAPNKLFTVKPDNGNVIIEQITLGPALEPDGYGTGAAVTDFDGDGKLELLVSHGEGNQQTLELYKVLQQNGNGNNWIRIYPKTMQGGPARGAAVKVLTNQGLTHLHVIDGGSGYLCEMEPYAHIGLGGDTPKELIVQWPNSETKRMPLSSADMNKVHTIEFPDKADTPTDDCPVGKWRSKPYGKVPVLCEGDRVTRGPSWRSQNQDGGRAGTVIRPSGRVYQSLFRSSPDSNWVMVRWENGRSLPYRMGPRGTQELCRCSDCGVDPRCGPCMC